MDNSIVDTFMTGQELLARIKENESAIPTDYLIGNGVTAYEFMQKWHELIEKYKDRKRVWSEIILLYQIEYKPLEENL